MICQRCGVLEATVHFSDPGESPRKFQWLCSKCADMIVSSLISLNSQDDQKSDDGNDEEDVPKTWDPTALNAEISQSKKGELLGRMFGLTEDGETPKDSSCSQCSLRLQQFKQSGLLGCPQCYVDFRDILRPFLSRLHGHTSHLGATPGHAAGLTSPHVKIMRLKVDMEKAIAAEDFEKAAILRDEIGGIKDGKADRVSEEDGTSS